MGTRDPRIDAYIAKQADFAQPILAHIRTVVHQACPDVEEAIKWGSPFFTYHGMLCGMAAFKQHCALSFWKGALVLGEPGDATDKAMGQFGRITRLSDLPSKKVLTGYIRKAMALNEAGIKGPTRRKAGAKPEPAVPTDLQSALRKNAKARTTFEGFSPSRRRDYIEWIAEAKGVETRKRRVATAVEWIAEGKPRNWKYTKR